MALHINTKRSLRISEPELRVIFQTYLQTHGINFDISSITYTGVNKHFNLCGLDDFHLDLVEKPSRG